MHPRTNNYLSKCFSPHLPGLPTPNSGLPFSPKCDRVINGVLFSQRICRQGPQIRRQLHSRTVDRERVVREGLPRYAQAHQWVQSCAQVSEQGRFEPRPRNPPPPPVRPSTHRAALRGHSYRESGMAGVGILSWYGSPKPPDHNSVDRTLPLTPFRR